MEKINLNGEIVDKESAKINVLDYGILYGAGLFETFRVYNGNVFRMDRHFKRLEDSIETLGLDWELDYDELSNQIKKTIEVNEYRNCYVRLTILNGLGGPRFQFSENSVQNYFIIASQLPDNISEVQTNGVELGINCRYARDENSPFTRIKSTNYLQNLLVKKNAIEEGKFDLIFLNNRGNLAETSTANLFLVKNNEVYTPSKDEGLIPGITREMILEICIQNSINVKETQIPLPDVGGFDEIFLTNSTYEVIPVVKIAEKLCGNGFPGPITNCIMREYQKIISKL